MLDPSLPLTLEERGEWGDPASCDATWQAMRLYSPYDGIPAGNACASDEMQSYPPLLVIAAEQDVRVPYTQSLRYISRLRHRNLAHPATLFHMRRSGWHVGEGGRFRRLEQASIELAFLMCTLSGAADN